MEYLCPVDDIRFQTLNDSRPPGTVIKGNNGAPDQFAPGHEGNGHPECPGVACKAARSKGSSGKQTIKVG